jgi:predicted Rossmann fold flavoprotein
MNMKSEYYDVIVIGGGAAGLMAAFAAKKKDSDRKVLILEKNEKTGKKLYITGKGRCNLTNDSDDQNIMKNTFDNPRFLYSALNNFGPADTMRFMEDHGLKIKVERGNRVFPQSDHSSDVIKTMNLALKEAGVLVKVNTLVKEILIRDIDRDNNYINHFDNDCNNASLSEDMKAIDKVSLAEKQKNMDICHPRFLIKAYNRTEKKDHELYCHSLIIATGGASYPSTGSDGFAFKYFENMGLSVTKLLPALVPFDVVENEVCRDMAGLSLKNVNLSLKQDGKKIYSELGEMLFTHTGVSGPLVLSASFYYDKAVRKIMNDRAKVGEAVLHIDLKPGLDAEKLDNRILRDFSEEKNVIFRNSLGHLLPSGIIPVIVERSGIDPLKKVNEVTKKERGRLVSLIKDFQLHIKDTRGWNEAIITSGGLSVKEIDPKTMELKKVPGMFAAGELIDCAAFTGGYNLQIAWSTGYTAGISS